MSTEALKAAQSLFSSEPRSPEQIARDFMTVATAYLAEHPADDDEPITAEWCDSIGGSWNGDVWHWSFAGRDDRREIQWGRNSRKLFLGSYISASLTYPILIGDNATRGDVRRLCAALGIELKQPEATA